MSTDRQEYSLDNQAAAIERYAEQHGFSIVQTYEDAGKSGLTIKQRSGLKDLLAAILEGNASYRAVLVYDVSRWGRFQDADEAAHYEYLCKQAGIPVYYAAEQFGDGDTLPSRIMKALKRTMAAEFSRELSEKVFAGRKRLAELGFHEGGPPGFGLRRQMISADGRVKQELKRGEMKSLTTDRVILVPGTQQEVKWIRWIHAEFIRGQEMSDIVKELNLRNVPWQDGERWNLYGVRQIITNPKYAGCNAWALTTNRLRSKVRRNPPEQWVLKPGAFTPIVDPRTFDRAQRIIANKTYRKPNEMLLKQLKRLWRSRGGLSESLIDRTRSLPACSTLRNRFGSMAKVYELIGFRPARIHARRTHKAEMKQRLRGEIIGIGRVLQLTKDGMKKTLLASELVAAESHSTTRHVPTTGKQVEKAWRTFQRTWVKVRRRSFWIGNQQLGLIVCRKHTYYENLRRILQKLRPELRADQIEAWHEELIRYVLPPDRDERRRQFYSGA